MDTTTAATKANVTTDTIRTWCRYGAVAAVKQAGRWVIDAASLAARIRLGQRMRRAAAQRRAATSRTRILAQLDLPALTGSPKQIAWAQDIRRTRIEQALTVTPHRRLGVAWHLRGPLGDPLGLTYLRMEGTYASEAEALAALTAAVSTPKRHTAKWWIDTRALTSPC